MVDGPFESFAQNGEDVVLWRALKHIEHGSYIDVGANHPTDDSVTRAFYNAGWRGIAVEPVPHFAQVFREQRPADVVVEAVATGTSGESVTLHEVPGTGLSTLVDKYGSQHVDSGRSVNDLTVSTRTLNDILDDEGWTGRQINFVSIDTEGSEAAVLAGFDLDRWRPWILVIESTAPDSSDLTYHQWEEPVLAAGYQFCLFDGLSRFYVAGEHAEELAPLLTHGACILDNYTTLVVRRRDVELARMATTLNEALDDTLRWRTAALARWTDLALPTTEVSSDEAEHLRGEINAIHETVSWRVTKPLRAVRGLGASVVGR